MKIASPDTEPLTLGRAWVADEDGRPAPRAEIDGCVCYIETKPALLALGVAICIPVEWDPDWPHAVRVADDDSGETRIIWDSTTDPRVVGAARKWLALCESGETRVGDSLL